MASVPAAAVVAASLLVGNQEAHPAAHLAPAPNPVTMVAKQVIDYIHPQSSRPIDAPLPLMESSDLVTGIYYNILFPEERQNRAKPLLHQYFSSYLEGKRPDFLTEEQFETLNSYVIKQGPKGVLTDRLAKLSFEAVRGGQTIQEALRFAQAVIQGQDVPNYQAALEQLQRLKAHVKEGSATHTRFTLLIEVVEECVKDLDKALLRGKETFESEFTKKGEQAGIALLQKWNSKTQSEAQSEAPSDKEQELERFENRLNVIEQAVDGILAQVPNGAAFLALQEATPDAVEEMKVRWKEKKFTWISFNNVTGKETRVKAREEEFGESTAFTSTLALSPALKVQRVALGSLPSPSGSERRILGVEVENSNTGRRLAIFTSHTDHVVQGTLYHDTASAVHKFVTEFLKDNPSMPRVFGGDLNAFEQLGAAKFIDEMRQGPFAGGQDYREGNAFFVPEAICDSTFIGRERDAFKAKFASGKLEPNALDQLLTNYVKVIVGTRSAAVYDTAGKLVDPYKQPELYKDRLAKRKTASDHLLNAVIFVG